LRWMELGRRLERLVLEAARMSSMALAGIWIWRIVKAEVTP
jgi:hypothetical protein